MLTGQAKKEYQRGYMRKYMQDRRAKVLTINGSPNVKTSRATTRFKILQRDGFRCQYCGKTAKDDIKLEIDHIRPICQGGTDDISNLITACLGCNRSKGGKILDYDAEQSVMSRTEQFEPPTEPATPELDADGNLIPEY